jgi:hypothetical protein
LANDIRITLGSDSFYGSVVASDLQTSPASDGTVAIVKSATNVEPPQDIGVWIYDDSTARPDVLRGVGSSGRPSNFEFYFGSIQWNADASAMFGQIPPPMKGPISASKK